MRKIYSLIIIATMMMVACDRSDDKVKEPAKPDETPALRLAEGQASDLQFDGLADSQELRFQSDINWMVRVDDGIDWFTVTPLYGEGREGDISLTVSVNDNMGDTTLEGGFDIVAGDLSLEITVSQRSALDPNSEYIYIADENFEAYLVDNFDTNGDGHISRTEAAEVTEIKCNDCSIASMEGIKNFTSLVKLDCAYNVIAGELDLSGMSLLEEAYVDHNLYTTLNLEGCSSLAILQANDNIERNPGYESIFHLKEINIKDCPNLIYIELTDNAIEHIDLSGCPELQVLRMTWNSLKSIDVTKCPKLTHLYIRKNVELDGVLDLSNCAELVEVWCGESKLTGVEFAPESPALEALICYDSKIEALDLSACPNLKKLEAHSMALTELDLTHCTRLEHLWLKFNSISELDLTKCPMLTEVQIGYNNISKLDLSHSPGISILEVVSNGLEEINLANCSSLVTLSLGFNNLTEIDLSDCASLFQVDVTDNKLTTLDVSNKSELIVLNFENNIIEELNINGCPNLALFYGTNNKLRTLDLRVTPLLQEVLVSNNELEKLFVDGLKYMYQCEFQLNNLERLNLTGCESISELYVQDNPLAYLSVYPCTSLSQLDMRRTAMKSIDLSNNFNTSFLFAQENPQLETVFIAVDAVYSSLMVDDHVEVWYKDAGSYDDDVNNGNWGDEDINPWASGDAA